MLAQEPYSLLASELGQLRPLDTDHAGFSGQSRLGIGNDSVEIVIRFSPASLWTVFAGVPESKSALPSLVIYLHPQAATVDFIAAKTRIAVTRGNRARAGVDQIVASDSRAVALRQPL